MIDTTAQHKHDLRVERDRAAAQCSAVDKFGKRCHIFNNRSADECDLARGFGIGVGFKGQA